MRIFAAFSRLLQLVLSLWARTRAWVVRLDPIHVQEMPTAGRLGEPLDDLCRVFEREALAFELFLLANRHSLEPEVRDALKKEYGEVLASPVLDLTAVVKNLDKPSQLGAIIEAWMTTEGLVGPRDAGLTVCLEEALLARARGRAEEVFKRTE